MDANISEIEYGLQEFYSIIGPPTYLLFQFPQFLEERKFVDIVKQWTGQLDYSTLMTQIDQAETEALVNAEAQRDRNEISGEEYKQQQQQQQQKEKEKKGVRWSCRA